MLAVFLQSNRSLRLFTFYFQSIFCVQLESILLTGPSLLIVSFTLSLLNQLIFSYCIFQFCNFHFLMETADSLLRLSIFSCASRKFVIAFKSISRISSSPCQIIPMSYLLWFWHLFGFFIYIVTIQRDAKTKVNKTLELFDKDLKKSQKCF